MKVALDKKLYRVSAVKEAAAEFVELADIEVAGKGGSIEVSFANIDDEVGPVLVDEFLNFALALTIASKG